MPIDEKIRHYIDKINEFSFVRTRLSCQGHFCKRMQDSIVYYYERRENGCIQAPIRSRMKNPMVVLKFKHKKFQREFFIYWIVHRPILYKSGYNLYIITPKNEKNVTIFRENSFFISRFDNRFVSVSYLMEQVDGFRYYKNKKRCDDQVREIRKMLFEIVIEILIGIKNCC